MMRSECGERVRQKMVGVPEARCHGSVNHDRDLYEATHSSPGAIRTGSYAAVVVGNTLELFNHTSVTITIIYLGLIDMELLETHNLLDL